MKITVNDIINLTLIFNKVEIITEGRLGGGGTVLVPATKDIDAGEYGSAAVRYIEPNGSTLTICI